MEECHLPNECILGTVLLIVLPRTIGLVPVREFLFLTLKGQLIQGQGVVKAVGVDTSNKQDAIEMLKAVSKK